METFTLTTDQERQVAFCKALKEQYGIERDLETEFRVAWQAKQDEAAEQERNERILAELESPEVNDTVVEQSFRLSVFWVWDNLNNPKPNLKTAPSRGAVAMLETYKEDRDTFFKSILPKAAASVGSQADRDLLEAEIAKQERKGIAELQRLLKEAVEASQA